MSWEIRQGDVVEVCRQMAERGERFHAVLCDPPYGLEFMGKEWDAPHKETSFPKSGNIGGFADGNKPSFARQKKHLVKLADVFCQWGEAISSVLYPGAIVFMFGGTRTWEWCSVGMQMAGFEKWDTLMWLYGQGFPKAQDISKLIDAKNGDEREIVGRRTDGRYAYEFNGTANRPTGCAAGTEDADRIGGFVSDKALVTAAGSTQSAPWSGHKTCALKPAWEPILAFRLPSKNSYAQNALEYGSGALNVDGGRIEHVTVDGGSLDKNPHLRGTINGGNGGHVIAHETERRVVEVNDKGRYPANLILDEESAAMLDEQSGELTSGANPVQRHSDIKREIYGEFKGHECFPARGADSGGASRFFYCAKADRTERDLGLDARFPVKMLRWSSGEENPGSFQSEGTDKYARNFHPTVKPIDLARYLASLLLPPDSVKPRRLFVPFSGSGSEIIGAMRAGWDEIVGVEQDADYIEIAKARIIGDAPLFNTISAEPSDGRVGTQMSLTSAEDVEKKSL